MKTNVLKRLEDLETQYKQDPLTVLAEVDGEKEAVKLSLQDYLKKKDAHFIKVIAGNNLEDLDALLNRIFEEVHAQAEGQP